MNQVLFVIIVLVIIYMFRDKWLKYMPNIVKKNVLVSGLVFGFALCFFMGNNIEGFGPDCDPADEARANKEGQGCGSECDCVGTLICTNGICSQPPVDPAVEAVKQEARDNCCGSSESDPVERSWACFGALAQLREMAPELGLQDLSGGEAVDAAKRIIECPP